MKGNGDGGGGSVGGGIAGGKGGGGMMQDVRVSTGANEMPCSVYGEMDAP